MTCARHSVWLALLGMLHACAQPPAAMADAEPEAGSPATGRPVIVRTVSDWPTLTPLADHLAAAAGVPVAGLAAMAPRAFKMTLACADDQACADAMARLAGASSLVLSVEPDGRKRLPARAAPLSPSSR